MIDTTSAGLSNSYDFICDFAFLPFWSYSPCFTQKYQFLRFHFNNSKFSFADLLKFIHNVRSHFFILEFVGGKFHVSAQLRNFNVLKQCFDHIKQGKFEFDFYSFYDSCVLSHNWQIYIYIFWFPCSNFSFPLTNVLRFLHNVFFFQQAKIKFSLYSLYVYSYVLVYFTSRQRHQCHMGTFFHFSIYWLRCLK